MLFIWIKEKQKPMISEKFTNFVLLASNNVYKNYEKLVKFLRISGSNGHNPTTREYIHEKYIDGEELQTFRNYVS